MSKKYKKKNEMKLAYDYSEVLKNKIKIIRKSTLKRGGNLCRDLCCYSGSYLYSKQIKWD